MSDLFLCPCSQCCTMPMGDLNTSDHLSILADMMYAPVPEEDHIPKPNRVDWRQAISSSDVESYCISVAKHLSRLASNNYDCVEEVEKELEFVG